MFDTLKSKLNDLLSHLQTDATAGTGQLVDGLSVAQAAVNEYFELAKKFAGGLKFASSGDEKCRQECKAVCDQILAECSKTKAGDVQMGAVNWVKLFQIIKTLITVIGPLLNDPTE